MSHVSIIEVASYRLERALMECSDLHRGRGSVQSISVLKFKFLKKKLEVDGVTLASFISQNSTPRLNDALAGSGTCM